MSGCRECGAPVAARGLCGKHYWQQRKSGALPKINVQRGGRCGEPDCPEPVFARGLCAMHYQRAEHDLKSTWKILRSRYRGHYPVEWDRFELFLLAVGDRPDPKYQLRRPDQTRPWSVANFEWVKPIGKPYGDCYTPEQRAAYSREWHLQKNFKISTEEFNRILSAQGGVCAGCRRDGTGTHHKSGKPVNMHVDHHHETGEVRGILCNRCNTAAGLLREDPASFHRLLAYLSNGGTTDGI